MNSKRMVLPLLSTAFTPGEADRAIGKIEDKELAELAKAEWFYFTAQREKCLEIAGKYAASEDLVLRLSANVLDTFGNLILGNTRAAQASREAVYECVKKAFEEQAEEEILAQCLFALYILRVLFHIPPKKDFPPMDNYLGFLSEGQRLFALHMKAHSFYLKGEYGKSQGILLAAQSMSVGRYPIPMIYMKCLEAACQMNLKKREEAYDVVLEALEIAKEDRFLEPFMEYHGLLQGVLEVCVRQWDPNVYKKLMDGAVAFGHGWMQIHNPETSRKVTDLLTPVEFSIAMLACRSWTNREIAEHMGLSVNTVKHHISTILDKLQIEKRVQIKEFVNE